MGVKRYGMESGRTFVIERTDRLTLLIAETLNICFSILQFFELSLEPCWFWGFVALVYVFFSMCHHYVILSPGLCRLPPERSEGGDRDEEDVDPRL